MSKRIWAAVLVAAVALSSTVMLPMGGTQLVAAATPQKGSAGAEVEDTSTDGRTTATGFQFRVTGKEATITGYSGTTKELAVPTKIKMVTEDTATKPGGSTSGSTKPDPDAVEYAVTAIADNAFSGNLGIQTVTLSGGLDSSGRTFGIRSIGDRAFFACHDLTTITIPSTATSIGEHALSDCVALTNITVSEGNTRYKVIEGALYYYTAGNGTGEYTLVQYPLGNTATEYKVPDLVAPTLKEIGEGAFWGSQYLETIALPAPVKTVGDNAFSECKRLKSVSLPEGLASLGAEAFRSATALPEITIPDGIKTLNNGMFQYCESLRKVNLPDTLSIIGNRAFEGCKSLTEFKVPAGVTMIGDQAFAQCENLREATIPMKTTSIGSGVFSGTNVTILCHHGSQAAIYAGNNGFTTERTYTVAFYTNNTYTSVISSQEVAEGRDAVAPTVEGRDGYSMSWSGSFTNIRQDTRVHEVWRKLFDVTFVDNYNGRTEVVKVPEGTQAQPPAWTMAGYTLSWKEEIPEETDSNFTVRAVWRNSSSGQVIGPNVVKPAKKGTEITKGNCVYKVYSASAQNPTLKLVGIANPNATSITIPETVSHGGVRYKVTMISANAANGNESITTLTINKNITAINAKCFYKCKNLKKIRIKAKGIVNMNNKAFAGIHSKAVFYTYESQKTRYRAMLKTAGVKKPTIKRL